MSIQEIKSPPEHFWFGKDTAKFWLEETSTDLKPNIPEIVKHAKRLALTEALERIEAAKVDPDTFEYLGGLQRAALIISSMIEE